MTRHEELVQAMKSGDCDRVQQLLSQYPDLVNSTEWTPPPLHCAVLWDQPAIADVLLDNGADIEMKDSDRQTTPLRYAVVYAKPQMIEKLLSRGANVGPIVEGGTSVLKMAEDAANGSLEEFEELPSRAAYREVVKLLKESGIAR